MTTETTERLAAYLRENVAYWEDRIAQSPDDATDLAAELLRLAATDSQVTDGLLDVESWTEALAARNGSDRGMAEYVVDTIRAALAASPSGLDAERLARALPDALSLASEQDMTYEFSEEPGSPYVLFLAEALAARLATPSADTEQAREVRG